MHITNENNNRILIKDDNQEVDINDGLIIQYIGMYYKIVNDIVHKVEIQTPFIGIVECERFYHKEGIQGIYIKPLLIYDTISSEWCKIINYPQPKKYSDYPHLLMLPGQYYHFQPLYFLHTCENRKFNDFSDITKEFDISSS
jgi:hypothetical protein